MAYQPPLRKLSLESIRCLRTGLRPGRVGPEGCQSGWNNLMSLIGVPFRKAVKFDTVVKVADQFNADAFIL